jgi:hypothetical protein
MMLNVGSSESRVESSRVVPFPVSNASLGIALSMIPGLNGPARKLAPASPAIRKHDERDGMSTTWARFAFL